MVFWIMENTLDTGGAVHSELMGFFPNMYIKIYLGHNIYNYIYIYLYMCD